MDDLTIVVAKKPKTKTPSRRARAKSGSKRGMPATQAQKKAKPAPMYQHRDRVAERNLDERLLGIAEQATQKAYDASLEAGLSVEIIEGETVYRVDPDGTRTPVREVEPPVPVNNRKTLKLR